MLANPRSKGRLLVALIWGVKLSRVSLAEREASPPAPKVPEIEALPEIVRPPKVGVDVVAIL